MLTSDGWVPLSPTFKQIDPESTGKAPFNRTYWVGDGCIAIVFHDFWQDFQASRVFS